MSRNRLRNEAGQSTVEFALVLPIVALVLLLVIQVARVSADYVAVQHAVREAARQAARNPSEVAVRDAARRAAPRLDTNRLSVSVVSGSVGGGGGQRDLLTVTVRYRAPTDVPLVGAGVGDVDLEARAVVRRE